MLRPYAPASGLMGAPTCCTMEPGTTTRPCGMTHVRTSPYYPQSSRKIERWHKSLKRECIRPGMPLSLEDARQLVKKFVMYYNQERLHSAIGYVTPKDKFEGREPVIFAGRQRSLAAARKRRSLAHSLDNDGAYRLSSHCQRLTITTASSGTAFGGNACVSLLPQCERTLYAKEKPPEGVSP